MRYFLLIENGHVMGVGKADRVGNEITETQYNEILSMLHNRPTAPDGFAYRLTKELEWELYELPVEDPNPELTTEEVLDIILGGETQ